MGTPRSGQDCACAHCGKLFYVQRARIGIRRHCSRKCAQVHRRAEARAAMLTSCLKCGKEFYVIKRKRKESGNYCSKECHYKSGRPQPKLRRGMVVACHYCAAPVYASGARLRRKAFCNKQCHDDYQRHMTWSEEDRAAHRLRSLPHLPRKSPNGFELDMMALLDTLGIAYLPQHVIGGKFCVDAFVPAASTVIQFDGDYWHANPALFTRLNALQRQNRGHDRAHDAYMAACGYAVLRIWQSDFERDRAAVAERLRHLAAEVTPP